MKLLLKGCMSIAALLAVGLFAACGDDDKEEIFIDASEPILEVSTTETNFTFTSAGNVAKELVFTTNRDWQVVRGEGDTGWLTLFKRAGNAGENIKIWVAASENTDTEGRSASFTLQAGGHTQVFTVYQAQKDAVIISNPDSYKDLSSGVDETTGATEEKIIEVELATNAGDVEPAFNFGGAGVEPWIKLVVEDTDENTPQTRALENHKLQFKVEPNDEYTLRIAIITIKSKLTEASAQIEVRQQGKLKPEIKITNEADFKSILASGATIPLQLETNASRLDELTVEVPDKDKGWVSVTKNADETAYELIVKTNTLSARSTTITVCAAKDHSIKQEMKLSQVSAAGVTITITNKDEFDNEWNKLGSVVIVKHKIDITSWDVAVSYPEDETVEWLEVKNKTVSGAIYLSMSENKIFKPRTATITIFDKENPSSKDEVTIVQAAATCMVIEEGVSLSQTIKNYGLDEATVESLELKGTLSNADWALLKTMSTKNKLRKIDLSAITNTTIPNNAFNGCIKLEIFILPQHGGLAQIPEGCCRNCTALKEIKIPEGVDVVINHAFAGCSALTKIYLPSTTTYLYGYCFEKCPKIAEIHLQCKPLQIIKVWRSPTQPAVAAEVFNDNSQGWKKATFYVPAAYVNFYKKPTPENCVSKNLQEELAKGAWSATCAESWFTWINAQTVVETED